MARTHPGGARLGGRRTALGDVPTAWKRPRPSTVVWLALVVAIYDGFLFLAAPEGILDIRLFYAPGEVFDILKNLGDDGRATYRIFATSDLGFIVVYSTFLVTWLRFLRVRRGFRSRGILLGGLAPGLFDAVETGSVLALLAGWPSPAVHWMWTAAVATPCKWASLLLVAVVIVAGDLRRRRVQRRR